MALFSLGLILAVLAKLLTRLISVTVHGVIIDHADGLHKGIEDHRADKFKSAFLHILRHGDGLGAIHLSLIHI